MISSAGKRRVPKRAQHGCCSKSRRRAKYACLAMACIFLVLCSAFGVSPSDASRTIFRNIGTQAGARLRAAFHRLTHRNSAPRAKHPRNSMASDESTEDDDTPVSESSSDGNASGQEEVAAKVTLIDHAMGAVEGSPLGKFVPATSAMIFRFSVDSGFDLSQVQREFYLGPTRDSIWYLITTEKSTHLLRVPCISSSMDRVNRMGHPVEAILSRYTAAVHVASRLPEESVARLARSGIGLPERWGTLLNVPKLYLVDQLVCGKYAIVYPPMQFNLWDLLSAAQLSAAAKMYLTVRVLQIVRGLHMSERVHRALSTSSFWLDADGRVYMSLPDDYSYGGQENIAHADGTLRRKRASGARAALPVGRAAPRTQPGNAVAMADPSDELSPYDDILPQSSSKQRTLRLKKKSPSTREELFALDASDLGAVVYQIWCGVFEKAREADVSRTAKRSRPVSFRNCRSKPPEEVKSIVKRLQSESFEWREVDSLLYAHATLQE